MPTCSATGCSNTAAVQWARRAADDPAGTDTVYGCITHAITLEAAALVHQAACPAPSPALLPTCGCTPEPAPPVSNPVPPPLPAGW